jgi:hypothetical protein
MQWQVFWRGRFNSSQRRSPPINCANCHLFNQFKYGVGTSGLLHLPVVIVTRLWMTYYASLAQYPKDYVCHQEGLSLLS